MSMDKPSKLYHTGIALSNTSGRNNFDTIPRFDTSMTLLFRSRHKQHLNTDPPGKDFFPTQVNQMNILSSSLRETSYKYESKTFHFSYSNLIVNKNKEYNSVKGTFYR